MRQIFWPSNETNHGTVFGWIIDDCVVVAGIASYANKSLAQEALSSVKDEGLRVLGSCSCSYKGKSPGGALSCLSRVRWISDASMQLGRTQTVLYLRPNALSMRFYSLRPMSLDAAPRVLSAHRQFIQQRMDLQVDCSIPIQASQSGISHDLISKMNISHSVLLRLVSGQRQIRVYDSRTIANAAQRRIFRTFMKLSKPLSRIFSGFPVVSKSATWVAQYLSTVSQIIIRIQHLRFLVEQYDVLTNKSYRTDIHGSARYIRFQNHVWLIMNDMILGMAATAFLYENRCFLAAILYRVYMKTTVANLSGILTWLDNWPAGLKLNTELSHFFYLLFTGLVKAWEYVLVRIEPLIESLIVVVSLFGLFGLTMLLSVVSDLLNVTTFHLIVSYHVVSAIHRTMLTTASSLWNLFRSKRYNTLRRRLESSHYDLDQLLLGSMFFTLITFLFPTSFVYYALFASSRFAVLFISVTIQALKSAMNHFPLFALTLRLKDSARLPGGLALMHENGNPPVVKLKNVPVSFSSIFSEHLDAQAHLLQQHRPARLLYFLVTGKNLTSKL